MILVPFLVLRYVARFQPVFTNGSKYPSFRGLINSSDSDFRGLTDFRFFFFLFFNFIRNIHSFLRRGDKSNLIREGYSRLSDFSIRLILKHIG